MPHFEHRNGRHALIVDGAPFLILGAQANNSSNYPSQLPKVWPAIVALHANTLEMPVAWEQIEPKEGTFDFSFVDTLVKQAREHNVRLVLLWFGTWKNTGPNYAPSWVKLDNARFPRLMKSDGTLSYALSPHAQTTLDADKRAFGVLMQHLREIDGNDHTVIMVQVENETGTYGSVRDYSPAAQKLFDGPVPEALLRALGKRPGTWRDVFGADADEYFHAWSIARYVEQVAEAGKAEYLLPMYANAALRDPINPQPPASYASGGPTWNVISIWKAAAPSLDVLAPDLYGRTDPDIMANLDRYTRPDNALMIVEIGNDARFARYFFPVIGRGGIGFAPFGLDYTGYANYPLGAKTIDANTIAPFALNFQIFAPMAREWAKLAYEGHVWGVSKPDNANEKTIALGSWSAKVEYGLYPFGMADWTWLGVPMRDTVNRPEGGVAIAELGPNEYLVTGLHARVSFAPADAKATPLWLIDRVEEGHYDHGKWVFERVWNGDQTDYGLNFGGDPHVLHVRLATY